MIAGVVLAGGKGVRMKSSLPKLFHNLLGKPIIRYVLDNLSELKLNKTILVIPPNQEGDFRKVVEDLETKKDQKIEIVYVFQEEPLGTGDALRRAMPELEGFDTVLVVNGDAPLITDEIFKGLLDSYRDDVSAVVLSTILDDPMHYGRVIKNKDGNVIKIVEAKDASEEEREIKEVNTGAYCFSVEDLKAAIEKIDNNNAQEEYYITQLVEILNRMGKKVISCQTDLGSLALGINSRLDLALATRKLLQEKLERLMDEGVTIVSPENTYIEIDVSVGKDTVIEPFSVLKGSTVVGERCIIGPSTYLLNAYIGNECEIFYSVIKNSKIESNVRVGPFAHIRDGTHIKSHSAIGDFVEVKKSTIGSYTKALHLSYLGDAEIGEKVNIGAGTITCNYDGKTKHKTTIEDEAFIGSNTCLRAPIKIGRGAITGAGSVVLKDVEPGTTVVGVPARPIERKPKEEGGKSE
ncbi:bifunctional UDP-N-acetylglucosamine diphosphorylase/glucosamine-1-phosphate N-acetyltransferase GlmU [bacterium]|nr:bifunctional UDP-N-acetylglucosamine diphosphorylase/glucosamine-1-phosphate N-acetyltransferase GlmU [bacterium]